MYKSRGGSNTKRTVSVRLTDAQAELVRGWIHNGKTLNRNLAKLQDERILAAVAPR